MRKYALEDLITVRDGHARAVPCGLSPARGWPSRCVGNSAGADVRQSGLVM